MFVKDFFHASVHVNQNSVILYVNVFVYVCINIGFEINHHTRVTPPSFCICIAPRSWSSGTPCLHGKWRWRWWWDVARWGVTTSPVTSGLAAAFRAASMKCFQFDSTIQRLVILSDVHVKMSSGKYWLAFFYLWTYKQRESSCPSVGETYQDMLERNT